MAIQIKPDGTGYLWDGEDLAVQHFGPCLLHGTHEWDYIKKAGVGGAKAKVVCPCGDESATCVEFDALP